ncbi:hypothetical protein ACFBZI_11610 [Moraxella sp. ZJ142]|uniref:hypothetical protein n=1 Tax=Moraxella marmotae TaxID=3344520 RepID=UPI0035D449AA
MNIQAIKAQANATFEQAAQQNANIAKLHATRKVWGLGMELIGFDPLSKSAAFISQREAGNRLYLFSNKTTKNPVTFWDDDISKLLKMADQFITEKTRVAQAKKDAKDNAPAVSDVFNIGDVLFYTWGWDCTRATFFQVVGFSGKKGILLREIHSKLVSENYYTREVAPFIDDFKDETVIKKQVKSLECGKSAAYVGIDGYLAKAFIDNKTITETAY